MPDVMPKPKPKIRRCVLMVFRCCLSEADGQERDWDQEDQEYGDWSQRQIPSPVTFLASRPAQHTIYGHTLANKTHQIKLEPGIMHA